MTVVSDRAIKSIVFDRRGTTYTATVGEFLKGSTPRGNRSGKENPYLEPRRHFGLERVVRIVDAGDLYLVSWEARDSTWANPFWVGKRDTRRVTYAE
jgi:hypothetical protein